jgi:DNA-directed RNA polymerase subunit RPC12/RpoP
MTVIIRDLDKPKECCDCKFCLKDHGRDYCVFDGEYIDWADGAINLDCPLEEYEEPEKEKPRRVLWTGWKGYRDTRYRCPLCNKPVKNDDVYCHRCGQKLMFPKVDWTPYVEGQKQELIVRWDDDCTH